jgi:hypothetical protein
MPAEAQQKAGLVEILIIISILISIIRIIQACRANSKDVNALAADENNRAQVEKAVRRHLGIFKYRKFGAEVVDALISRGKDASQEELDNVFDAVGLDEADGEE